MSANWRHRNCEIGCANDEPSTCINGDDSGLRPNTLATCARRSLFSAAPSSGLLLTDPAAREPRATEDVDVVIEVGRDYGFYNLEDRLRNIGFRNDPLGPVCRFLKESISSRCHMRTDQTRSVSQIGDIRQPLRRPKKIHRERHRDKRRHGPAHFLASKLRCL